jgi:hypothetical protein
MEIPRPSQLVRNVDPASKEWVCQLADLLLDSGAERNAVTASSSARDISRLPGIGEAVFNLTSGVMALRSLRDVRLTPSQEEILRKVLDTLTADFSESVKQIGKQPSP